MGRENTSCFNTKFPVYCAVVRSILPGTYSSKCRSIPIDSNKIRAFLSGSIETSATNRLQQIWARNVPWKGRYLRLS